MDMLQRRRPFISLSPYWCVLCKRDGESAKLIFLHCQFSKAIWDYFFYKMSRSWVMPDEVMDFFCQRKSWGLGDYGKIIWACLIHVSLWVFGRNKISKNIKASINRGIKSLILLLEKGELASLFRRSSKACPDFMRDWVLSISSNLLLKDKKKLHWLPPSSRLFKLNFDNSSKENMGVGGFGCVLSDSDCNVISTIAGPLGSSESTKA